MVCKLYTSINTGILSFAKYTSCLVQNLLYLIVSENEQVEYAA